MAQGYVFLLTTSAITVILLQIWVTRQNKSRSPFMMMGLGAVFYMIGFGMYGVVSAYWLFALAIVVMPTSQALAANFATEDMRGRYMAVFGLTYMIPAAIGPGAAGIILDSSNPDLLWAIGSVLCAASALSFYGLYLRQGRQERFVPSNHLSRAEFSDL